jgi:hypothetical protein
MENAFKEQLSLFSGPHEYGESAGRTQHAAYTFPRLPMCCRGAPESRSRRKEWAEYSGRNDPLTLLKIAPRCCVSQRRNIGSLFEGLPLGRTPSSRLGMRLRCLKTPRQIKTLSRHPTDR